MRKLKLGSLWLAIAMGLVCVITQWSELEDKQARLRLMWTQALHWLAVLVTMNIMLFSGVQQLLPTLATSLVLLILLALGTFLAGVHLLSLQIGFLGFALALAVPCAVCRRRAPLGNVEPGDVSLASVRGSTTAAGPSVPFVAP